MTARRLDGLAWTDVAERAAASVLVVPLGATEQHGPHLPFTVDTEVAAELARRLAEARPWVVLAPAVPYGSSGEHAAFPGTLSIGRAATELLILELVRSADAFAAVLLVSGHGGNAVPVGRAVATAGAEGRNVHVWAPTGPTDDSHAGRVETSVMLALRPDAVRTDRATAGNTTPLPALLGTLRTHGVAKASPTGVLGDPRSATVAEGHRILAAWTTSLVHHADQLTEGAFQSGRPTEGALQSINERAAADDVGVVQPGRRAEHEHPQ